MDAIRVNVTGERQVGLLLEEFPNAFYDALLREVNALTRELLALIQARTPTRTGQLRSEERARVYADQTRIAGRVSVAGDAKDAAKAGALEYGAHRATSVRAHQMHLDHVFANALAAPMNVLVDAYTRTPDIAEVAFERGSLGAMEPEILERLNAVAVKAVGEANG
jgi:hypothetical protein